MLGKRQPEYQSADCEKEPDAEPSLPDNKGEQIAPLGSCTKPHSFRSEIEDVQQHNPRNGYEAKSIDLAKQPP